MEDKDFVDIRKKQFASLNQPKEPLRSPVVSPSKGLTKHRLPRKKSTKAGQDGENSKSQVESTEKPSSRKSQTSKMSTRSKT